jgi:hypothetical protein
VIRDYGRFIFVQSLFRMRQDYLAVYGEYAGRHTVKLSLSQRAWRSRIKNINVSVENAKII